MESHDTDEVRELTRGQGSWWFQTGSGWMSYSQGAYLLVSGNRKLIFFPSKHKAATRRDDDSSMQKSEVEEKKKKDM